MTATTTIPHEALRQHAGILGTTGSGKTYAARKCLEWLLAAAPTLPRVCVADEQPEDTPNPPQGGAPEAEVCSGQDREEVRSGEGPSSEQHKARTPAPPPQRQPSRESAREGGGLPGPHQRIVDAIVWWAQIGVPRPTRVQVAVVSGYTASGGTFNRYLSALSSQGLVSYPDSGTVSLTRDGSAVAQRPTTAPSLADLHRRVMGVLEGPHQKLMRVLLEHRGREVARTHLAELAGYEASGGTFNRYCSHLSSLGLIRYPKRTTVAAAPILFPEKML